jgi:endonuclease YncB( thermonuclease family)
MFAVLLPCVLLTAPGNLKARLGRIADGDTITVLVDRQQVWVRLSEIDGPERSQDFSQRGRQALAGLMLGKPVKVVTHGKDRYGRVIGRLASRTGKQATGKEALRQVALTSPPTLSLCLPDESGVPP